jgi:hypothetical protein
MHLADVVTARQQRFPLKKFTGVSHLTNSLPLRLRPARAQGHAGIARSGGPLRTVSQLPNDRPIVCSSTRRRISCSRSYHWLVSQSPAANRLSGGGITHSPNGHFLVGQCPDWLPGGPYQMFSRITINSSLCSLCFVRTHPRCNRFRLRVGEPARDHEESLRR